MNTINLKDVFNVESRPVNYKNGPVNKYFLIKGKPGSHQVREDDVENAKVGYESLPQAMKDAYKPYEVFWLAVAASQHPELIPSGGQTELNIPNQVQENLESLVKQGATEIKEGVSRPHGDTVTITVYDVLSDMDRGYASIVRGVSDLLSKKKEERDLKAALSLAIYGTLIQPAADLSESLLNKAKAPMPYRPY